MSSHLEALFTYYEFLVVGSSVIHIHNSCCKYLLLGAPRCTSGEFLKDCNLRYIQFLQTSSKRMIIIGEFHIFYTNSHIKKFTLFKKF